MPAYDQAILDAPCNPFADSVARLDASLAPPPDVHGLHGWVRSELCAAIATVRGSGRAAMVLVKGDPGQGKTHELTWLRRSATGQGAGPGGSFHFLEIPPLKDPGAPFQHMLRYAVHGLLSQGAFQRFVWEALRRVAVAVRDAAQREGDEETQSRLDQVVVGGDQYIDAFRAMVRDDRELGELLLRHGRSLPPLLELDPDFGRVLCHLPVRSAEAAVLDWLRGAELPEEDLRLLGITRPLDSEAHCFEVLRSLVRISLRPLAFCFDQIESTRGLLGLEGTVALFNALMELYQQLPVCVVLMCQTQVWMELCDHVPLAARERIRELPPLPKPDPDNAVALVAARMQPLWQSMGLEPPYPSYPFSPAYLRSFVDEVRPTVRQVLTHCSAHIDRMRVQGTIHELTIGPTSIDDQPTIEVELPSEKAAPPETAAPQVAVPAAVLNKEHQRALRDCNGRADLRIPALRQERLRSAITQLLQAVSERRRPLDGVRVLHVDAPPKPRSGARPPIILTYEVEGSRIPLRVALDVHSDDARGAVHALERLHGCLTARAADAAILLRESEARVGDSAKRTLELARSLEPRGGLLYLAPEAAHRLVAAELLLDAVSAAEVWLDGERPASRPITREEAITYLIEQENLLSTLAPITGRLAPPQAPYRPGPESPEVIDHPA